MFYLKFWIVSKLGALKHTIFSPFQIVKLIFLLYLPSIINVCVIIINKQPIKIFGCNNLHIFTLKIIFFSQTIYFF